MQMKEFITDTLIKFHQGQITLQQAVDRLFIEQTNKRTANPARREVIVGSKTCAAPFSRHPAPLRFESSSAAYARNSTMVTRRRKAKNQEKKLAATIARPPRGPDKIARAFCR